jgi:4-amino-4-deoxychorismate lyase
VKRPAHITHVNGVETSAINIADRGLAYGDGLFETMRVVQGQIPLLKWHLKRFLRGVEVLGFGSAERLQREFVTYTERALEEIRTDACLDISIIKLIVTRGSSGRGYVPPLDAHCQFILQVFDQPDYPKAYALEGIALKQCEYRLAKHPLLAGIKHLNRLDQVLASQELLGIPEGVLLDYEGHVIEGTKSNILIFKDDRIMTPNLDACGVQGVLRDALIAACASGHGDLDLDIVETVISYDALLNANGLAMINSIFGLWPVQLLKCVDGTEIDYKIPPQCEIIQQYLKQTFSY